MVTSPPKKFNFNIASVCYAGHILTSFLLISRDMPFLEQVEVSCPQ